jgi:hypothetical protein
MISAMFTVAPSVWACSVCFKDPNSPMTVSLQQSVFVLLGFLLIIFCAFIKFIYSFARRSQAIQEK